MVRDSIREGQGKNHFLKISLYILGYDQPIFHCIYLQIIHISKRGMLWYFKTKKAMIFVGDG